jgi:hypothetical protein
MTCPISQRLLEELVQASVYGGPGRTIEDAKRQCDPIRRELIEHAKKHDCLRLGK